MCVKFLPGCCYPFDNLDAVLQDAFSSKYKSALHSGAFKDAVKKYRQKKKAQTEKKLGEGGNGELRIPVNVPTSIVEESTARAQHSLENLPGQVLGQARAFHRHIQYFVHIHTEPEAEVPPDLKVMLDDISRARKLDERMKDEILQDEDARNVSTSLYLTLRSARVTKYFPRRFLCLLLKVSPPFWWYMSISDPLPGSLRELIDIAEDSLSALAERDLLAARHKEQQASEYENPKDHASGSGTHRHGTPHGSDAS